MRKRYILPLLMMAVLSIAPAGVHAAADTVKTERVELTDENRYNEEYYGEPTLRFPEHKTRIRANGRETAKSLEEHIVEALGNFETEINVSAYNIPKDKAGEEYFKILNNNPQLFYVKGSVSYSYSGQNIVTRYQVSYIDTEENVRPMQEALEAAANEAAAQVDTSLADYQQALIVHDYLTLNCEYDKENFDKKTVPDISHTAYGSLVNQIAVCDGYADAFSYIMERKLGIPCEVISSDAMAHAWNMIEIGGKWYHTDITWDDPTWDSIGRSMHSYFLLSDGRISDADHNHHSWVSSRTADSTAYDNAFWADVRSAICYNNGSWYYSKYQRDGNTADAFAKAVKLVKRANGNFLEGPDSTIYEASSWSASQGSYYTGSYMYLDQADDTVYFNTADKIYKVNSNDTVSQVYSPALSDKQIYGFTVRGNELWYALQDTANPKTKQVIEKYAPEQVTGITAEDVTAVYDGQFHTVIVQGMRAGDVVKYADASGKYQDTQPDMVNAGTYEVRYRVERDGFLPFHGTATVTIVQAEPQYEIPRGLSGQAGGMLVDIALPAGFTWQEPKTQLEGTGNKSYPADFTPEDSNYKTVSGIEIPVEVVCVSHDYTSEITIQPGPGQDGEERFTCRFCGHTYTQKIDGTQPPITGIAAEDVTGVYNGSAYTITVTGVQEGDVVRYAAEEGAYGNEQPDMVNAGTYKVLYKVERNGYLPYFGEASVVIERAVPRYTVPTGLQGKSGALLTSIELPDGFIWQADADARLSSVGNQKFEVCYVPEDQVNYRTVTDIKVTVRVACPGHQYDVVTAKEPTETQKGERRSVCRLCGHTFTEEIPMLSPSRPQNVSGLKAAKNTANTLSFSWNKTEGVNYRLMFYQGNKVLSTEYVEGGAYTYGKLKSATVYTLRVLPYREVNGRKVYAKKTVSLKTATAPDKVKFNEAKKLGKNRVKLKWKKTVRAGGYEVSMKTGNGKWKKIKTIGNGSRVFLTKTKLARKTTYTFRLRAYVSVNGKKIYGAYSSTKKVKIK